MPKSFVARRNISVVRPGGVRTNAVGPGIRREGALTADRRIGPRRTVHRLVHLLLPPPPFLVRRVPLEQPGGQDEDPAQAESDEDREDDGQDQEDAHSRRRSRSVVGGRDVPGLARPVSVRPVSGPVGPVAGTRVGIYGCCGRCRLSGYFCTENSRTDPSLVNTPNTLRQLSLCQKLLYIHSGESR